MNSEELEQRLNDIRAQIRPMNVTKTIVGNLISLGTATAVYAMMKSVFPGMKLPTRIVAKLGVFVFGCMLGDMADQYFRKELDEIAAEIAELKKEAI